VVEEDYHINQDKPSQMVAVEEEVGEAAVG